MHEPIDEGDDAAGIGEDFGPFLRTAFVFLFPLVMDDGVALVAASDDLEEQVGVTRVVG